MIQDATYIAQRAPRTTGESKATRQQGEPRVTKASDGAGGSACAIEPDRFEYCQSDLTEDHRVPVLITFPSDQSTHNHSDNESQAESAVHDNCKRCPLIPQDERLELPLINGFSTYVEPEKLEQLADILPEGTSMTLNHPIRYPLLERLLASDQAALEVAAAGGRVERLPNIEKVWDQGFKGAGQKIVVIDSGIHPHPDLEGKIVEWVDFSKAKKTSPLDEYGHGTHVAGLAAGSGVKSNGEIIGVAPEADLVGLRITTVAEAIKALQWCVENKDAMGLKVINMSLGEVARRGHKFDPWALAVQKATEAGLVVCVAAGNEGPNPGSISTPGIYPGAITVGAYDSKGTPQLEDDTVWKNSSQGPTIDNLAKPDVLAPGVAIFGPLAPGAALDNAALPHRDKDYFAISGTSQATPMIAGLAAILLEANPSLDAAGIQTIMKKASGQAPIHPASGKPAVDGAGLVDAEKALALALAARPETAVA